MVLNAHIRVACLLLLLLASLTTGSVFPHQTRQLADLQTQDTVGTVGATAGLMPGLHQLRRRDTHFPICTLCCGCCKKSKCGWCCKT